jgi:hypothetical protein
MSTISKLTNQENLVLPEHIFISLVVILTFSFLQGLSGEMQGGSKMGSNDAY